MKKQPLLSLCGLALAAAFLPTANAEPLRGTAEASAAYATLNGTYPDAKSVSASAVMKSNQPDSHGNVDLYGLYASSLQAWGGEARQLAGRWLAHVDANHWVDATVGVSDQGRITPAYRATAVLNSKALVKNMVLGLGLDHYAMRGGTSANGVQLQGVYYSQSMPLVTQINLGWSESSVNHRQGASGGIALTYGVAGNWTITASASQSRVHYELAGRPGAIAEYPSSSYSLGGRTWLNPGWGVTWGLSQVNNRYYNRTEVRGGAFWQF